MLLGRLLAKNRITLQLSFGLASRKQDLYGMQSVR
jgi:hypothetical protein